ncbi:MAG: nucleotide exchange factor GrpE [bacterium]|nr:nucleotide exchange factor GrpE [bacterium]
MKKEDKEKKDTIYTGEDIEIVEEGSVFAEDTADEGGEELPKRLDKLRKDLASCRKEKQEYLEGWQRAKADLINHKKDETERKQAVSQFASEDTIYDILPVLDSFDLALKHDMPPDVEKGIRMIKGQLEEVLKRKGVETIAVTKGDAFDSAIHESIGETESDAKEGTIAEEVQRGYRMYGKVIRASRVKIAKGNI